jgi:hypothetical protein
MNTELVDRQDRGRIGTPPSTNSFTPAARSWALVTALVIGMVSGCGSSGRAPDTTTVRPSPPSTTPPSSALGASPSSSIRDMMQVQLLGPIKPGTYFIDPDGDPSTSLRVVYKISAPGWSQWIGAAKPSGVGLSGFSVTTVSNLVTDGCLDHTWAEPPVGTSVDDLAAALADLKPFRVTSSPSDVTAFGYRGKHLTWRVPELPVRGPVSGRSFVDCVDHELKSWVAFVDASEPGDAFYGYTGPGYVEEFWILDVEGTRLMIAAEASVGSPAEDLAERDAILDSIRIEP